MAAAGGQRWLWVAGEGVGIAPGGVDRLTRRFERGSTRATYSWSKVKKLDVGAASPASVVAIADSFQAQPGFR